MSPSTLAPPTLIGGRYSVERELGYGATATVYLCRDRETGAHVAVKVLRVELAESLGAERFLREIRLTAGLQHEHIVSVLDSGADGSTLYCVLPHMEGGTLRDVLRDTKQLAIPNAVQIGCTIAGALEYAHEKGLIHRDIKPENILFSGGRAFLGDFGIARLLHATAGDMLTTTTGVVRGTPAYMSPEQASGERDYDGRSDIYSLACVVYEMVSGMPPFVGPTSQSVLAQRFLSRPRPMSVYRNTITSDLEQVIDTAMATSPADRYATAKEFADSLRLAGQATTISIAKSGRRRKAWVVAACAAAIAGVAAAGTLAAKRGGIGFDTADVKPDTTQLALIPFTKDGNTDALGSIDALVYNAFSAWRGITVLEPYRVRDAVLKRESATGVIDKNRAVAVSLGAGRYVSGAVGLLSGGRGWTIQVWLNQVDVDTALKSAKIDIMHADLASVDVLYASLAKKLLLRAGARDSSDTGIQSTTHLGAMQSFAAGIDAVDEWDFASADSLFQRALDKDPSYARAALWQAQIRSWQRPSALQWSPLAERAINDSLRLPVRERRLASALHALGTAQFDTACARYRRLTEENRSDFAAWFGLGRCQDMDYRVERSSPSSPWRYHASFQGAMRAYQTSFEVLSLSHRSMERGAFQPLRDLLAMRPSQLRRAVPPEGDPAQLIGRLDKDGDTLVMRPISAVLVSSADPAAVPKRLREAITSQQQLFRSIATKWSTSLPRSSAAKEAVAVSLEMAGDPAALDTLRAAYRLTDDSAVRLRLLTSELVLRIKLLKPTDVAAALEIRRLADSIIASNASAVAASRGHVAVAAIIRGDCEITNRLMRASPLSDHPGLQIEIRGAADALAASFALGCDARAEEIEQIRDRILSSSGARPDWVTSLLGLSIRFALDRGFTLSSGTIDQSRDYLTRAQVAARSGLRDSAQRILKRLDVSRALTGYEDVRPEAIYLEARLYLRLGDTTSAIVSLDRLLDGKRYLTPGMLNVPPTLSSLLNAMRLRGELATERQESTAAAWTSVVAALRAPK